MVEPRTGEAEAEDQRRLDPGEALLEVGGILLGHPVDAPGRKGRAGGRIERIEIADDGHRRMAEGERPVRAAIGCDEGGREAQRLPEIGRRDLSAAHKRDRL